MGTTGLVLGLGLTGSSPANAVVAPFVCDSTNRAIATGNPVTDFNRINDIHNSFYGVSDPQGQICLSGDFVLNRDFDYGMNVHFYGEGTSSISHPGGQLFGHQPGEDYTLTIENLTVKNSSNTHAIRGTHVVIKDSTFSGHTGGAIYAIGDVTVTNSVFTGNSGTYGAAIFAVNEDAYIPMDVSITGSTFSGNEAQFDGGAVYGYGSVLIANSTFVDNTANLGGAAYALPAPGSGDINVTNSTFINNVATGNDAEGGALFAMSGQVIFSTFINNTAPEPVVGQEVPGNAIYKAGSSQFNVGGNIFAGSSPYPQLGYGVDVSPFIDLGGNVFSTSSATETDITQDDSSVFGASLISIFGTATPALATFSPNSSGTQTIGLVAGSPALNIVPNDVPFTSVTVDQRGATRSHPADAGAFEGVVAPTPTPSTAPAALAKTGSQDSLWATIAAGSMLAVGGLVTFVASRLRRQTK
jgi:LPXTG-motif cell wall-anchored protein